MMLSTFSRTRGPPVCPLWKNVYSDPLPIFKSGFFFLVFSYMSFSYMSFIYYHIYDLQIFSLLHSLIFYFVDGLLFREEAF